MRVADYIFQCIAEQGVAHVFFLPGGGAMHLNNALLKESRLQAVSMLHEQGAAIAAEGYARTSGRFGVCLVTSGPGVTNAITGLAGAWLESTPVLFLSGQVKRADLKGGSGLRQLGIQELDIIPVVNSLSKYAVCLLDPQQVRYELGKALHLMRSGRPGPVWLDIPLDVQATEIDPEQLPAYSPETEQLLLVDAQQLAQLVVLLRQAQRPVLLVGNGIHAAHAEVAMRQLVEKLQIPTLTSWIAADLLEDQHPLHFGRCGTVAPRGANFTLQNADLLLTIGCRLDFSITGFNRASFARAAKIAVVDIDAAEIAKLGELPELRFHCDAGDFIKALLAAIEGEAFAYPQWLDRCHDWRQRYPVLLPEYRATENPINLYVFTEVLCQTLAEDDLLIPGSSGAAVDTFWLAAKLKRGQRAIATGGLGAMGYGLPAAIGGCLGSACRRTISVDGDGGFMLNIQELAVVSRLALPIKCFVINNNGYASVRASQSGYFRETIGCDQSSGLTLPSITAVARAFGIETRQLRQHSELKFGIQDILDTPGPVVCEVITEPDQPIIPRIASRLGQNGSMVASPLEDLSPFLSREELAANMLIPLVDE